MHIYAGEKYKICEVYAWIWNKLYVLNIILWWFCHTMLQQTISWMKLEDKF